MTKPRKWFGQRFSYQPLQGRPEITPRVVTRMRFLKKAPYKVTYGEFTYAIQPVALEEEKVSYIAARMLAANGRLHQPLHEYELSRRFANLTEAEEVWTAGFESREDSFLVRALIERMIDEQAAEIVPAPALDPASA